MKRISVLLADDHKIVREAIRMMLELQDDIEVVGEAQDGREAVAMTEKLKPDVVLLDIAMPRLNGLEATRQVRKKAPATQVIILSAHSDDAYVKSAVESGAVGFLLKQDSCLNNVCAAIRAVQQGKTFFNPLISRRLDHLQKQFSSRTAALTEKVTLLTSREIEVLQLVAESRANKETAAELGISIKTVEKHRGTLMAKLDIHDTAGLTRYAISAGVVETPTHVPLIRKMRIPDSQYLPSPLMATASGHIHKEFYNS